MLRTHCQKGMGEDFKIKFISPSTVPRCTGRKERVKSVSEDIKQHDADACLVKRIPGENEYVYRLPQADEQPVR